MLLSLKVDTIPKKRSCKQNLVRSGGSCGSKVILILLIEVIIFYIRPTIVNVKRLDFEELFWLFSLVLEPKRLFE